MTDDERKQALRQLSEDDVRHMYSTGKMSPDDANEWFIQQTVEKGNWLDLEEDQVEPAYRRGYITADQTDKLLDYQENPFRFHVGQFFKGAVNGFRETAQDFVDFLSDAGSQVGTMHTGDTYEDYAADRAEAGDLLPETEKPVTFAGKAASEITEFATGFVPTYMATGGLGAIPGVARLGTSLASKAPKLATFLGKYARANVASGLTTMMTADVSPDDPDKDQTITGMLAEHVPLLDPVLGWMKVDADDSSAVARLKLGVEDTLLGLLMEKPTQKLMDFVMGKFAKFRTKLDKAFEGDEAGRQIALENIKADVENLVTRQADQAALIAEGKAKPSMLTTEVDRIGGQDRAMHFNVKTELVKDADGNTVGHYAGYVIDDDGTEHLLTRGMSRDNVISKMNTMTKDRKRIERLAKQGVISNEDGSDVLMTKLMQATPEPAPKVKPTSTPDPNAVPGQPSPAVMAGATKHGIKPNPELENTAVKELADKLLYDLKNGLEVGNDAYDLTDGVFNPNIWKPEANVETIERVADGFKKEFDASRGGEYKSIPRAGREAEGILIGYLGLGKNAAGKSLARLKARVQGLDAQLLAHSAVIKEQYKQLKEMALTLDPANTQEKVHWMLLSKQFYNNLMEFAGVQTNVARGLNVFKYMGDFGFDFSSLPKEMVEGIYVDHGRAADIMHAQFLKLLKGGNEAKAKLLMKEFHGNTWSRAFLTFMQANVLSSWVTIAGNLMGNTATAGVHMAGLTASLYSQAFKTGQLEAGALAKMAWQAWGSHFLHTFSQGGATAFREFALAMKQAKGNWVTGLTGKIEAGEKAVEQLGPEVGNLWKALLSGRPQLDAIPMYEQAGGIPNPGGIPIGKLIESPFRALAATDEPFQAAANQVGLFMGALERGMRLKDTLGKPLSGADLTAYVERQMANPAKDLLEDAFKTSRDWTFKTNLEGSMKAFHDFLNIERGSHPVTKAIKPILRGLFMPFDKVPMNVGRVMMSMTPGAPSGLYREAVEAGGVRKDMARFERVVGAGLLLAGMGAYGAGYVRGRIPREQKGVADAAGIQENAWKNPMTGKWESLTKVQPPSSIVTIGADIAAMYDYTQHLIDEGDAKHTEVLAKIIGQGITFIGELSTNFVAMESANQFLRLLTDPNAKLERVVGNQAAKFMPFSSFINSIRNTASAYGIDADAELKQINTIDGFWSAIVDGFWNKHFNRSDMAPARHILYGTRKPVEATGLLFGRQTKEEVDPILKEISDLYIPITRMDNKLSYKGVEVKLTNEQYQKALDNLEKVEMKTSYGTFVGMKQILNEGLMGHPKWATASDELRAMKIRDTISKVERKAKMMAAKLNADIREEFFENYQQMKNNRKNREIDPVGGIIK